MNSIRGMFDSIKKPKKKRPSMIQTEATGNFRNLALDGTNERQLTDITPPLSGTRPPISRNWSRYEYAMPPTEPMAKRVAEHHRLVRKIIKFLIHPMIQTALPPDAKIADLNCGAGSFFNELSGDMTKKNYEMVGFDTMPEIFPGTGARALYKLCPGNMRFIEQDILHQCPAAYRGYFDSVHTSFLGPVLVSDQWNHAFDIMVDLAKPGGWIQAGTSKACHQEMAEGIAVLDAWWDNRISGGKRVGLIAKEHPDIAAKREELYNTAELNDVRQDIDKLAVQAWERLLMHLTLVPDSGWDKQRVERVVMGMEAEVNHGVYITLDVQVVIARKKTVDEMEVDAQSRRAEAHRRKLEVTTADATLSSEEAHIQSLRDNAPVSPSTASGRSSVGNFGYVH
ncbi:uncharacterized protein RSE6_10628 [Rhynchosporium secalis]|uniref:Methyltransferase domain-containing protein n=1 Tax=Rhynchosporium secalis TaxID=38038 RepID=A0A1E1MKX3_RHYSE|nr:uncharacterized protein RSE6_10628 [Rhynchosporium secalis]